MLTLSQRSFQSVSTTEVSRTANLTPCPSVPVCKDFKELSEENTGLGSPGSKASLLDADIYCSGLLRSRAKFRP